MAKRILSWALPGIVFTLGFGFAACSGGNAGSSGDCKTSAQGSTGSGGSGGASTDGGVGGHVDLPPGGDPATGANGNDFHHPVDPASAGQNDPFEILKQRADEGPPEIRTRLHSCSRISYSAIGNLLASRGVNLDAVALPGDPPTAGELYKTAQDALGAANFDARQGEASFYTIAAAIKLMDIFVQAAPEIIANIDKAEACKLAGQGHPMFDPMTGKCVYSSVSCLTGRAATTEDLTLCNFMLGQADPNNPADVANKKRVIVATFLSAANTCE